MLQGGKPLDPLTSEITVRHGMPDYHHSPAKTPQFADYPARDWTLAATRPNGAYGDDIKLRHDSTAAAAMALGTRDIDTAKQQPHPPSSMPDSRKSGGDGSHMGQVTSDTPTPQATRSTLTKY